MASLVDLTAQLLIRVASYLYFPDPQAFGKFQDDSFCNLRFSCCNAVVKARCAFGKAAFSTVLTTLHPESLLRFRDITEDPGYGE